MLFPDFVWRICRNLWPSCFHSKCGLVWYRLYGMIHLKSRIMPDYTLADHDRATTWSCLFPQGTWSAVVWYDLENCGLWKQAVCWYLVCPIQQFLCQTIKSGIHINVMDLKSSTGINNSTIFVKDKGWGFGSKNEPLIYNGCDLEQRTQIHVQ